MSTDITPDNTPPQSEPLQGEPLQNEALQNAAPAPDPSAVAPRHRRHRGRSTAILAGVVAAAVAGGFGVGQLDRPAAAKTQNAAAAATNPPSTSSGTSSSGTSSSGTSSSDGSSTSNADWSPYGGYGYGYGGYSDPWGYVPSYGYGNSGGIEQRRVEQFVEWLVERHD